MPGAGGHLDPTMQAALQADSPLHGFAVEIAYPTFTVRLLDGAGFLELNGDTFVGLDATYGALVLPEAFADGISDQAPSLLFGIQAPTNAAAAALCDPTAQGSVIKCWYWAADSVTGLVVGSPYLVWYGYLDAPTLVADKSSRLVKIDAESPFGPFLDSPDGNLLSNSDHQALWPGELGLQFVVDVQQVMPWGADSPRPVLIRDVLNSHGASSGVSTGGFPTRPQAPGNPVSAAVNLLAGAVLRA
ncbi:MAG TPA: hypothetical protein VGG29_03570 [Caulobacteraceae bacterium]|jgi:hypothetical protein